MVKIGGHVSAAGELGLSISRAKNIGAQTIQFFISPPQQWLKTQHSQAAIDNFVNLSQTESINPSFIHGTYLVNLGTDKPEHLQKSIEWLTYALNTADKLKATGIIFHTGSHSKRGFETVVDQVANALNIILGTRREAIGNSTDLSPNALTLPFLILENSAGGGGSIGSKFSELGEIIKRVKSDRVKVCIDTCHAWAAGYNVKTPEGLKNTLEEFDQEIGLQNLVAIHANDAKFDISSHKDRHENIGEGFIGKDGFANMLNNEYLQNIPFILEVPGFAGTGPDKENIDILQSLVSK